jgi:hypothetical protein
MNLAPLILVIPMVLGQIHFERHDIDDFPAGYQVAVADVSGNGRLDVIAISTEADRVDWYENPVWRRRPVARTARNIDLAPHDLDGDGRPELAVASGFHFADGSRGGEIQWLHCAADPDAPWEVHPIAADPVTHRVRWGDLDGDGKAELVHAPIFGPGSHGPKDMTPCHLWAFRVPSDPARDEWPIWKIDETLTVLHGLWVGDLDDDGRDEILAASFEGIFRFDFHGDALSGRWQKTRIGAGAEPTSREPGAPRGSTEVAPGSLGPGRPVIAAIEPWHGHQLVIYTPPEEPNRLWTRHVLDQSLREGHALVVADFDGDGVDEIVAGWRGAGGGLAFYDLTGAEGIQFAKSSIDEGIAVEGALAADMNGNGRLDLVVIAGRTNNLAWYENRAEL